MRMTTHIQYKSINQRATYPLFTDACCLQCYKHSCSLFEKTLDHKITKKGIKENKINNKKTKTVMRQNNVDN